LLILYQFYTKHFCVIAEVMS